MIVIWSISNIKNQAQILQEAKIQFSLHRRLEKISPRIKFQQIDLV